MLGTRVYERPSALSPAGLVVVKLTFGIHSMGVSVDAVLKF